MLTLNCGNKHLLSHGPFTTEDIRYLEFTQFSMIWLYIKFDYSWSKKSILL